VPQSHQASRFHAYLEHIEDRSVFTFPRLEWDKLKLHEGNAVPIDVDRTPMSRVASSASVIAAVAAKFSTGDAQIHVYRRDPQDAPTPVNLDKYTVWEQLPTHLNYKQMVAAASTDDDQNLRDYLSDNVFLVKDEAGPDHWLPCLPASVMAIFAQQKLGAS
jgi:hypothetical protein